MIHILFEQIKYLLLKPSGCINIARFPRLFIALEGVVQLALTLIIFKRKRTPFLNSRVCLFEESLLNFCILQDNTILLFALENLLGVSLNI